MALTETYLGDGLYASWDGWHIMLRAPREDGDHWVALEPAVWRALRAWYWIIAEEENNRTKEEI